MFFVFLVKMLLDLYLFVEMLFVFVYFFDDLYVDVFVCLLFVLKLSGVFIVVFIGVVRGII